MPTNPTQLVRDVDKLVGQYEARAARRDEVAATVKQLTDESALLTVTESALQALLQQTSAENLKAIEELVTSALQAVFDDRPLTFHLQVETQRGQQALVPLIACDGVVEGPMLESHGGGPAQIVAAVLRILTVHRLGLTPLIALDESLSMVAAKYVPNAARFIVGLCERMGLTILLVTHQQEFVTEATRAYQIVDTPDAGRTFATL